MTEQMRNHWWWRPGWRPGRRMYTWHMTFDGQAELHDLVDAYQQHLADLPGLDPVPRQWLHLTTQGLGFTDETPADEVTAVIKAVREHLAEIPRPTVTVGPASVDPEVVRLKVQPVHNVVPIRKAIRDAITATRGHDKLMEPDEWSPHVSVAYSNSDSPMQPIAAALRAHDHEPATVNVREVQLIVLSRDRHVYEWETHAAVPIGA